MRWTGCFITASVAILTAQPILAQKIPPPPYRESGQAAYYLYQDVDYVSYANGSSTACPSLKAIRSKCYQEGVNKGDIKYEHECYCSADNAYQVVQCFADQYSQMESGPVRDNYYASYLAFAYDCYCGVTGYDVTYNVTQNPPVPYIDGYTGDCALPPDGGCPAKQQKQYSCPQPPVVQPPPKQIDPPSCPSGYSRCNGNCIPPPPKCKICEWPRKIDYRGECSCPYPLQERNGRCVEINFCYYLKDQSYAESVVSPYGGYCACQCGYQFYPPGSSGSQAEDNAPCCPICPKGYKLTGKCVCSRICEPPLQLGYNGQCVCPTGQGYIVRDGRCVWDPCDRGRILDYCGVCSCPYPNYYDYTGYCRKPLCSDYNQRCLPNAEIWTLTNNRTYTVSTSAPAQRNVTLTYNTSLYTVTATTTRVTTTVANVTITLINGGTTVTVTANPTSTLSYNNISSSFTNTRTSVSVANSTVLSTTMLSSTSTSTNSSTLSISTELPSRSSSSSSTSTSTLLSSSSSLPALRSSLPSSSPSSSTSVALVTSISVVVIPTTTSPRPQAPSPTSMAADPPTTTRTAGQQSVSAPGNPVKRRKVARPVLLQRNA